MGCTAFADDVAVKLAAPSPAETESQAASEQTLAESALSPLGMALNRSGSIFDALDNVVNMVVSGITEASLVKVYQGATSDIDCTGSDSGILNFKTPSAGDGYKFYLPFSHFQAVDTVFVAVKAFASNGEALTNCSNVIQVEPKFANFAPDNYQPYGELLVAAWGSYVYV